MYFGLIQPNLTNDFKIAFILVFFCKIYYQISTPKFLLLRKMQYTALTLNWLSRNPQINKFTIEFSIFLQTIALLLPLACWLIAESTADYRYKVRGPPQPPRPPHMPQYAKKWSHPPRSPPAPVRSRPIPVHMPPNYKIPMGSTQGGSRPIAPPVRNFWKNTQNNNNNNNHIRSKIEKKKQKPFLSSPPIGGGVNTNKEYDYHLNTNAIPMHTNTIKQVGEKGPIHTIPAPNLSLADKPAVVDEVRSEIQPQKLQQIRPDLSQLQLHQYQVTESNEPINNIFRAQQIFYQDLSGLEAQTSVRKAEAAAVQPQKQTPGFGQLMQHAQSEVVFKSQEPQAPINDVYQFLNYYPQQNAEIFKFPPVQQQILTQSYPNGNYEQQNQEIQPEFRQESAKTQQAIQPEYHSFNYDEQRQKGDRSSVDLSSLVTADYSLEPAADSSELLHSTIARNPSDVLAQSQYVQQYFDTREDNAGENNVEPDAKAAENVDTQQETNENNESDVLESAFYASLPNRQAAEALASLQAAGKINNDKGRQQSSVTMYVQENSGSSGQENGNNKNQYDNDDGKEVDYEEYPSDEPASTTNGDKTRADQNEKIEEAQVSFGSRIKPKRN